MTTTTKALMSTADRPPASQWDGKNLYKPDQSHMAYPIENFQGGDCPSTHPVHLVSLFYEWV